MKKLLTAIFIFSLAAALLAGCGRDEPATKEEGNYIVSEEAPTEEQLGVPIYPGAKLVPGSGGMTGSGGGAGDVTNVGGIYETDDGFDRVVVWYTDKLGQPFSEIPGEAKETTWMIGQGSDDIIVVSIIKKGGRASISINRMSGRLGQ